MRPGRLVRPLRRTERAALLALAVLLGATLLSSTFLVSAGGLIWLAVSTSVFDYHIGLVAGIPLLLGVVQPIWKQVIGNHGFTVYESPDAPSAACSTCSGRPCRRAGCRAC